MADWGPVVIAVVLFVLLTPGLLFQIPGRNRVIEFGNMHTSGLSILVHTLIFFGLITIFLIAIGVHVYTGHWVLDSVICNLYFFFFLGEIFTVLVYCVCGILLVSRTFIEVVRSVFHIVYMRFIILILLLEICISRCSSEKCIYKICLNRSWQAPKRKNGKLNCSIRSCWWYNQSK